jgi:hypothetical protein
VVGYQFRSKDRGWHGHLEKASFEDGSSDSSSLYSQVFRDLFYSHLMLRPGCHECRYCSLARPSDLTIADFWGVERAMPDLDDNKGTSMVLVNSAKGKAALEPLLPGLRWRQASVRQSSQPQLNHPAHRGRKRSAFWRDFGRDGYESVARTYGGRSLSGRLGRSVRLGLKRLGLLGRLRRLLGRA